MDHFDVMTGPVRPHVTATRFAIYLCSYLTKNGGDDFPRLPRTSRHQGRTFQRAFFPSGNAHPYVMNSFLLQFLAASLCIGEKRVSSIDQHVASLEERHNFADYNVHRLASLDHHHRYPRFLKRSDKFLHCASRLNVFSPGASGSKFFRDLRGAVEHRNRKTLRFQIQSEVLAHHSQAD